MQAWYTIASIVLGASLLQVLGAPVNENVIRIGRVTILASDLRLTIETEKAYGRTSLPNASAAIILGGHALWDEVARQVGVSVTSAEVSAFGRRADANTKAPQVLAKVKAVFGVDRAAYERLYVAPKVLDRKLRAWYAGHPALHADAAASIAKALEKVRAGASFQDAAAECLLVLRTFETGKPTHKASGAATRVPAKGVEPLDDRDEIATLAKGLAVGETLPRMVSSDEAYRIVRLAARNGGALRIEVIESQKRHFSEWFEEQATKVYVDIFDQSLKNELLSRYEHVPWVQRLTK